MNIEKLDLANGRIIEGDRCAACGVITKVMIINDSAGQFPDARLCHNCLVDLANELL